MNRIYNELNHNEPLSKFMMEMVTRNSGRGRTTPITVIEDEEVRL
jgi:hypothetical protein